MPRDTTPEFAALELRWWMGLSGEERVEWWRQRQYLFASNRFNQVRSRHPGASFGELMAMWTEETYCDSLDPGFLAFACARIREYWDAPGRDRG